MVALTARNMTPLPPYWNNSSIQEDMTIIKNAYNVIFLYVYILFDVTFNVVIALSSILCVLGLRNVSYVCTFFSNPLKKILVWNE